jgi:hypothetical protein
MPCFFLVSFFFSILGSTGLPSPPTRTQRSRAEKIGYLQVYTDTVHDWVPLLEAFKDQLVT